MLHVYAMVLLNVEASHILFSKCNLCTCTCICPD